LSDGADVLVLAIESARGLGNGVWRRAIFDRHSKDQRKNRLIKRLANRGYAADIKPLAA